MTISRLATPATESLVLARSVLIGLFALFFSSGALALIYEVIWQRQFALVFGGAAPATAAVLAAYFAGLGLGSRWLGVAAAKWKHPLRVYGALEGLTGAGALMVTPLLHGFERMYPWLFGHFATSPVFFVLAKLLLAFVSIGIPTFCMGGTLPVLGELLDRGERRLGINAGLLYVANTFGAALGAVSVPFLFLPMLGANRTVWVCIGGNVLVALAACCLDWFWPGGERENRQAPTISRGRSDPARAKRSIFLLALISGLVAFVLQVLWNRAFAQVHENSMYSFAVITAVFILALAVGAQLARVGLRHQIARGRLLGWSWVLSGCLLALTPFLFMQLTNGLAYMPSHGGWSHYAERLVLLTTAVLFVPVTLLGVALPVLMDEAGQWRNATTGNLLGQLMAVNVTGSVVGALMAGFLLPRVAGLWTSILLSAAVLVLAGGWQFHSWRTARAKTQFRIGLVGTVLVSFWLLGKIEWPRVRISPNGERLLAISEGPHGIVAVVQGPGSRRLKLNNHYVLGGTSSTGDERMQTHLPLVLHPSPHRIAILGIGTGITASGALFHSVENITAVEMVPEVVAAAREHFSEENIRVLEDPRTRVIIDDARNFLRGAAEKFDVIVGDLVVPWRQGEGALFTLEHFQAARQALTPGGVFCQWLPLFQISEPELQILLRTFLSVFPHASVWRSDFSPVQPAIALVGGIEPFELKPPDIERRLREMRLDPLNPQLSERADFWMYFIGVLETPDLPPNDTRVNREDRPWIELLGPLRHGGTQKEAFITGRRFQAWAAEVKQRTQGRSPMLGTMEGTGREAGDLMLEFTLLLSEGNQNGARTVQARLQSLLPEQAFQKIFPEAPAGGTRAGPLP